MDALLGLVVTVGIFAALVRVLAPSTSKRVMGWFPRADRGIDRSIIGQTERRGVVLAALAAASLAELVNAGPQPGPSGFVIGILAAILFRVATRPVGLGLGVLGTIAAFGQAFEPSCSDPDSSRAALTVSLTVCGLLAFGVLRFMFAGVGWGRGNQAGTVLCAFGIVSLAAFIAGPFGTDLTDLVGLDGGLAAVVATFALIVVGAALLPSFSTSIIGVALLAATLAYQPVVTEKCETYDATVPVLVAFVAVWWLANRFGSKQA